MSPQNQKLRRSDINNLPLLTELWKSGCVSYKDSAPTALFGLRNNLPHDRICIHAPTLAWHSDTPMNRPTPDPSQEGNWRRASDSSLPS